MWAIFHGSFDDFKDFEDFYNIVLAFVCVISAAIASGLTNGLMAFDAMKLQIKSMTGSLKEIAAASVVLTVIKMNHHLVLVTLLLYNSLAMEALPIFLGALVPNWVAVLMGVTLILIFGEIVPSALFLGKDQLFIAARFVPFVKVLITILYPISYPISVLLDKIFGHEEEESNLTRQELDALMQLQITIPPPKGPNDCSVCNDNSQADLSSKEVSILTSVLRLAHVVISDVMIKMDDVYCLSADLLLDDRTLQDILSRGFSRIPVYNRKDKRNILGSILVKNLIVVDPNERRPLRSVGLREPLVVSPEVGLLEMLQRFQTGRRHLALVSNQPEVALASLRKGLRPPQEACFIGIVTLENVFEKIIQEDIADEYDRTNGGCPADVSKKAHDWNWHKESSIRMPMTGSTGQGSIQYFDGEKGIELGFFDSVPSNITLPLDTDDDS